MGNWRLAQRNLKLKRSYQTSYQSNIPGNSGRQDGGTELAVFQKKKVLTESYEREKPGEGAQFRGHNNQVREEDPRNDVCQAGKRGKWEYDQGKRNESQLSHGGKRKSGKGWGRQMKRGKGGHGSRERPESRRCPTRPRMTVEELNNKLASCTINTEGQPGTNRNVSISSAESNFFEKMEIEMPIVKSPPEAPK
ncbi:Hypothetical predicted protein [Pelobates cultripes]|uniref:Uncharacterized protein n=1 Tax=Pelobates cultripes TaxID=61616 RepID=A0AAD1WFZ5_PELCU|nr:Hypothetical predicted protein [Pelobates cultripes]